MLNSKLSIPNTVFVEQFNIRSNYFEKADVAFCGERLSIPVIGLPEIDLTIELWNNSGYAETL